MRNFLKKTKKNPKLPTNCLPKLPANYLYECDHEFNNKKCTGMFAKPMMIFHQADAHDKEVYFCNKCHSLFYNKEIANLHIRMFTQSGMIFHQANAHDKKVYFCNKCHSLFYNKKIAKFHIRKNSCSPEIPAKIISKLLSTMQKNTTLTVEEIT